MSAPQRQLLSEMGGVLFDLDGTLLNTAPDLVNALRRVCEEQSTAPPDFEAAACQVSNGAMGLTRLAFPELTEDSQTELCQRLIEVYADNICVDTRPYPGMTEVLEYLDKKNIPWGVVTNKLERLAVPILEALDLMENCMTVVGGDTAPRNKPHPDPINHALKELRLAADSVAYVGDHLKDVQAGQAAGTRTVAVSWGYRNPGEDPYSWGADYTIDRPDELLTLPLDN